MVLVGDAGREHWGWQRRKNIVRVFTLLSHVCVLLGPFSPSLTGQFYLSIYLFK